MSDKTTVTNPPVSESGITVKPEADLKEMENRVRENLRAEHDRKTTELSEKLAEATETIKELQDQMNLTRTEQDKLNNARDTKSDIEKDLNTLETQPEYGALREKFKRETERVKNESISEAEHRMSVRLMEKLIVQEARKEKVEPEDLRKELNKIAKGRWSDKMPDERVELAIEERERLKSESAKDEEIKKLKAKLDGFSESGTAIPRNESVKALRGSDKMEDQIAHGKALGL